MLYYIPMSTLLEKINLSLEEEIQKKRKEVEQKRQECGYVEGFNYFVINLDGAITLALGPTLLEEDVEIEFIDRKQFGADVAIKVPKLLKKNGVTNYIQEILPKLVFDLKNSPLRKNGFVTKIETKSIYLNILLDDDYLTRVLKDISNLKDRYGQIDFYSGKKIVIDYSSPNMAKHLHPGHIRSTIAGEVLANIYEAVGFTVFRLNYINDWGGIGFIMEGYEHWKDLVPNFKDKNDLLYAIYCIYRKGEIAAKEEKFFSELKTEEKEKLIKYFGIFDSYAEFKSRFELFTNASNARFNRLENGDENEVALWQTMRSWSLENFKKFYGILNINHDYTIGESFYAPKAKELVEKYRRDGKIVLFGAKELKQELRDLKYYLEKGKISENVFKLFSEEAEKNLGASVIFLENNKKLVVARSDGTTIYATRDIAGIEHRVKTFLPDRLVYETGQEQSEYFEKIFEASRQLGLFHGNDVDLTHLSHGFYVDAETKRKLSSREGSLNVNELINESIKYFRKKYEERDRLLSSAEKDASAKMVAVGSIVFNDIKQERRFPIFIHNNLGKNIKEFEESGGAYVMYTIARAKSIKRKASANTTEKTLTANLSFEEVGLIKKLADFPRIILKSAENDNPAVLAEYLLSLANEYNSFYEKYRVLNDKNEIEFFIRFSITEAVAQVLENGMVFCHAPSPEVI